MSRLRDTGITSGRVVDIVNHKFSVCDKLLHLIFFFSLSLHGTFPKFTVCQDNDLSSVRLYSAEALVKRRRSTNKVNRKTNNLVHGLIR